MKLFTTVISIRSKNKAFHHLTHLPRTLWMPRMWSICCTHEFIVMGNGFWLYDLNRGQGTPCRLNLPVAMTLDICIVNSGITEMILLSNHCIARQGGSLSHLLLTRSFALAHCLTFLRFTRKSLLFSKMVPVASTPSVRSP